MSTAASTLLAIAMLAAFLLVFGGAVMWFKHGETKRGLLMIAAAAVLIGNVLIWTI